MDNSAGSCGGKQKLYRGRALSVATTLRLCLTATLEGKSLKGDAVSLSIQNFNKDVSCTLTVQSSVYASGGALCAPTFETRHSLKVIVDTAHLPVILLLFFFSCCSLSLSSMSVNEFCVGADDYIVVIHGASLIGWVAAILGAQCKRESVCAFNTLIKRA